MKIEMNSEERAAFEMVKAIVEDGEAEINGNVYKFTKFTHKERKKVFAFFTSIAGQLQNGDMSFIDFERFDKIEEIISKHVTYKGSLLSVIGNSHWEENPGDYIPFVSVALQVISFPFMPANATG